MNRLGLIAVVLCLGLFAAPTLAQYCVSTHTSTVSGDEWVSNVTMGTINNSSALGAGAVGYEDYTALSTTVLQGAPVAIDVSVSTYFTGDIVKVFCDWDGNSSLDDAGEETTLTVAPSGSPRHFTGSITAPGSSVLGPVRMRVKMVYTLCCGGSSTFGSCGTTTYGNTEDYTLTVTSGPTPPTGSGSAAPAAVFPGGSTVLTVAVTPGTNPPSTGLAVTGDLSSLGGSASQAFTDNMDGTFSYMASISGAQTPGPYSLPFTVSDAEMRSSGGAIALNVLTPPPANDECASPIALVRGVNPAVGYFSNAGATNSAGFGYPCQFGNLGFADVFFTYTPPCSTSVTFSTCTPAGYPEGTNGDTHIDVYTLADCPTPGGAPVACNDDSGCGLTGLGGYLSNVTFAATGGTTYLIRVSSYDYGGPDPTYFPGTFYVTVTAPTASSTLLGPGCSDGGGAGPTLSIDAPPVLGTYRTLTVAGAAPGSGGMMLISNPAAGFTSLPGGCTLYLDQGSIIILALFTTDGTGSVGLSDFVPSAPSWECAQIAVQGFVFPASAFPIYQVTDGLLVTLGY